MFTLLLLVQHCVLAAADLRLHLLYLQLTQTSINEYICDLLPQNKSQVSQTTIIDYNCKLLCQ